MIYTKKIDSELSHHIDIQENLIKWIEFNPNDQI